MVFIYVLKLTENKYYIGKTTNPSFRLHNHFLKKGSTWTKKYKPISVYEIKPDCDDEDEDKITQQYMKKYGIDNVRGGSFCQIKLDSASKTTLIRMITGATDKCYNCGGNHFIQNCRDKKNKVIKCNRCNRDGHIELKCYAKTDIYGNIIVDDDELEEDSEEDSEEKFWKCDYCYKEFDSEKGCRFHENIHCKKKSKLKNKYTCNACGRSGHKSSECYAKKTIDGDLIKYVDSDDY
jgi:cellular nucleic acid-binding protein